MSATLNHYINERNDTFYANSITTPGEQYFCVNAFRNFVL